MRAGLFKSKLYLSSAFVILALTGVFLGKELFRRYQIDQEIKSLNDQVGKLQEKNQQVSQLIEHFKTPEYKERQARELLNLQKPGEFAVALPVQDDKNSSDAEGLKINSETNLKKWWNYFFEYPGSP